MPKFRVFVKETWAKIHEVEIEADDYSNAKFKARYALLTESDVGYEAAQAAGLSYVGMIPVDSGEAEEHARIQSLPQGTTIAQLLDGDY